MRREGKGREERKGREGKMSHFTRIQDRNLARSSKQMVLITMKFKWKNTESNQY